MTDGFEAFVRGGLERAGLAASDEEMAMMRAVDSVYGPALEGLRQVDLGAVDAELDLDPSRPPA